MFTSAKNTKNNKVRDGIQIAGAHEVFQTLCRPAREVMAQTRPSMMAGCGMVEEADAATGQDRPGQGRTGQDGAEQARTGQKAEQARTGQAGTGQNRPGQGSSSIPDKPCGNCGASSDGG